VNVLRAVVVSIGVGGGTVGLVALGVLLVRWARRNPGAGALGLLEVFRSRFGDWVDDLNESPSIDDATHCGGGDHAGTHFHGSGTSDSCDGD
jgi:hypothetical protein